MNNKDSIKKFITSCTVTFKAFEYDCELVKSSATIWNFVAKNKSGDKVYAVYCAPKLDKAKSLIRLASKKLKPNMRLVVITQDHSEAELESSLADGYVLLTLQLLNEYGEEMIHARAREAKSLSDNRENIF